MFPQFPLFFILGRPNFGFLILNSFPEVAFPPDPLNVTLRDSILYCGTLATSPHLPHQTPASHFP